MGSFQFKAPAKRTNIVCQTFRTLLVKHACPFGHHNKHCLTSIFCLLMFLKFFENIFCLSQAKNVCQAPVCVVAKPTNIVLDKKNFQCLPNSVCLFGRGSTQQPLVSPPGLCNNTLEQYVHGDQLALDISPWTATITKTKILLLVFIIYIVFKFYHF